MFSRTSRSLLTRGVLCVGESTVSSSSAAAVAAAAGGRALASYGGASMTSAAATLDVRSSTTIVYGARAVPLRSFASSATDAAEADGGDAAAGAQGESPAALDESVATAASVDADDVADVGVLGSSELGGASPSGGAGGSGGIAGLGAAPVVPPQSVSEIIGDAFDAFREFQTDEERATTRFKTRAATAPEVPSATSPAGFTWTVETFLARIARGCEAHADKFDSWEALFTARGREMRKLGIPTRERRWILRWTEHYRQGLEPVFISKARSKARKNNPGMEKRRRQKYPGWADYMFPDLEETEREVSAREEQREAARERARKEGRV